MENYILSYNEQIQSGKIKTSDKVKKIYLYLADLVNGKFPDFHYEPKLAEKVIKFIETFCVSAEGQFANKPLQLMLWQKAFLSAVFAIVDKDGLRKFKETFLVVGRKNGKSGIPTLTAVCFLYLQMTKYQIY